MFQIQPDQIDALQDRQIEAFIDHLAELVDELSPPLAKTLDDEDKRRGARQAYDSAAAQGFDKRGPIRFWLDLCLILGSDFATDPQYADLARLLEQERTLPDMHRADSLHQASSRFLLQSTGPDAAFLTQALKRLRAEAEEASDLRPDSITADCLALMQAIYPEKFDACGADALRNLVIATLAKSRGTYGFEDAQAQGLMVMLAYLLGHSFDQDPFLPWIGRLLVKTEDRKPEEVAEKLRSRALIWLDAALDERS